MECTLVRGDGSRWTVTDMRLRHGRPRVWAHQATGKATRNAREHWETLDGMPLKTTDRLMWRDGDGRTIFELRGRFEPSALDGASGALEGAGSPTEAEVRDAVDDGFFRDSFLTAEKNG